MAFTARANRAFLGRAVRYLAADAGMRQFLDIGTGIPTAGNTHEVAQALAPESRVVYVDYDPVVLAHARALLTSHEAGATEYIDADLRDTHAILAQARQLLDFTRPVAVTLLAILNAIPDADDPHAIVARIMDAVPSGSYLAISHPGSDLLDQPTLGGIQDIATRTAHQQPGPQPRAGGTVLRRHGPRGARASAGRGMAPRPGRRRCGRVVHVVRGRAQALTRHEAPWARHSPPPSRARLRRALGPYALSRRTSSVGRMTAAGSAPSMAASSSRTISRLIRWNGCLMVVRAGRAATAADESSNPPTATSSGTRRPARRSAASAPTAIASDATKTASRSGQRSSSRVIACSPEGCE